MYAYVDKGRTLRATTINSCAVVGRGGMVSAMWPDSSYEREGAGEIIINSSIKQI